MRCPYCGNIETRVTDTRTNPPGTQIRRRRRCPRCGKRFTTFEQLEIQMPIVVKRDGRREPFQRNKLYASLAVALRKRPVPQEKIEAIVERIESRIAEAGKAEVTSRELGEMVMRELRKLDQVAYVRFASVYREFQDVTEFIQEIRSLMKREK
jgi:transcriptional repressor NrdR